MKVHESLKTVTTTSKIVALVFFLVLVVISFFIGAWFQRNVDINNQAPAQLGNPVSGENPTATPTPTVLPTQTSAGTVFTNSTYKYTVTYPSTLYKASFNVGNQAQKDQSVYFGTKSQADFINSSEGGFDIGLSGLGYMAIYASTTAVGSDTTKCNINTIDDTYTTTCKTVTVGGIKGTEYITKRVKEPNGPDGGIGVGMQDRSTYFMKNGVGYTINVYDKNNDYTNADKIINSFKFN